MPTVLVTGPTVTQNLLYLRFGLLANFCTF